MLLEQFPTSPARIMFFTGKGGVGNTTTACATAIALAGQGKKVLLVCTDPASNLSDVLETAIGESPLPVTGVHGLFAINIDPQAAAHAYRERVVGPYRGVLPEAALASIEEQLSGACTTEIAAFDEFVKLLGDDNATESYHREVSRSKSALPEAITTLLPRLRDQEFTSIFIVALPEATPVEEAAMLQADLRLAGIEPAGWIVNRCLSPLAVTDPVLVARQAGELPHLERIKQELSGFAVLIPWQQVTCRLSLKCEPLS